MGEYLKLIAEAEACIEDARENPSVYGTEDETALYDRAAELFAEAEKTAYLNGLDDFLP